MGLQNSKIMICKNIKLEKDYKDVLDYTETQMVTLCTTNAVATANNYSFIRKERGWIQTGFSYSDALKCNYMAFQNPDYDNKWFFAFIDDVEYSNDGTARIKYTVDEFSTWWDYWSPQACLVLREHAESDNIGENTYPENLEHGDYIVNDYGKLTYTLTNEDYVVIATSWLPSNTPNLPTFQMYGGIFSGVYYLAFSDKIYAQNFLLAMDGFGKTDEIVSVFMAPSYLCSPSTYFTAQLNSKESLPDGSTQAKTYDIHAYFVTNNSGVQLLTNRTITENTTLNGVTPVNNKLYCYPYNFLLISNGQGIDTVYNYEDFVNNTPTFDAYGVLCPGCSIKLYPKNYRKYTDTGILGSGFNEGMIAGKYPICSYHSDAYINWLTQQSVNTTMQKITSAFRIGGMVLNSSEGTGNPARSYGGLFQQQASYLSERYQRAITGDQTKGNINGADVTFAADQMYFTYYKKSIKAEYVHIIDEYFTKFGYATNRVKLPNQTHRTNWNFVQIGSYENIGYSTNSTRSVPAASMEIINGIYRNGVTIWHSHANLGNYSLSNSITN